MGVYSTTQHHALLFFSLLLPIIQVHLHDLVPWDKSLGSCAALRSCAVFRPLLRPGIVAFGVRHFAIDLLNRAPLFLFPFLSSFCSDLTTIHVSVIISTFLLTLVVVDIVIIILI